MSSDEQSRVGGVAGGDENLSTLMTMLFAIESIEKSKGKTSSDRREDPAEEIRKLCTTLDGLLGITKDGKVSDRGVGYFRGRSRSGGVSNSSEKFM